jgi:hypothetical protein
MRETKPLARSWKKIDEELKERREARETWQQVERDSIQLLQQIEIRNELKA